MRCQRRLRQVIHADRLRPHVRPFQRRDVRRHRVLNQLVNGRNLEVARPVPWERRTLHPVHDPRPLALVVRLPRPFAMTRIPIRILQRRVMLEVQEHLAVLLAHRTRVRLVIGDDLGVIRQLFVFGIHH